jgi:hypothetical protein
MRNMLAARFSRHVWLCALFVGLVSPLLAHAAPVLAGLTINCSPGKSGQNQEGWVYLSEPATSQTRVDLTSSTNRFTVPAFVNVPTGKDVVRFVIGTSTLYPTTGTITATRGALSYAQSLTTTSAYNETFCVGPVALPGGANQYLTGWARIGSPAPVGGLDVSIGYTNAAASGPATITIPEGLYVQTFSVDLASVQSTTTGAVTADISGNYYSVNTTVKPPWLKEITLNVSSVTGGNSVTGTIGLRQTAAVGGTDINVTSNNSAVTPPDPVTVPYGYSLWNFTIDTDPVVTTQNVVITAEYNGIIKTANLTVTP